MATFAAPGTETIRHQEDVNIPAEPMRDTRPPGDLRQPKARVAA
jgi:hypothetical protein